MIVRSPRSIDDLFSIWSYISERNEVAADALLERIDAKLRLLAEHPSMGRERSEIIIGLRSVSVGKYILLYQPVDDGIMLIRVLHGARDLAAAFRS